MCHASFAKIPNVGGSKQRAALHVAGKPHISRFTRSINALSVVAFLRVHVVGAVVYSFIDLPNTFKRIIATSHVFHDHAPELNVFLEGQTSNSCYIGHEHEENDTPCYSYISRTPNNNSRHRNWMNSGWVIRNSSPEQKCLHRYFCASIDPSRTSCAQRIMTLRSPRASRQFSPFSDRCQWIECSPSASCRASKQ